jgi:hypothetical protein
MFTQEHLDKQKNQNPYVAYSIQDGKVIYTKIPNYLCLEPIDSNNQLGMDLLFIRLDKERKGKLFLDNFLEELRAL